MDPEVLSAIGEATDQGPTWGEDIHSNLTQLWQPLLTKGMSKENKHKILKQYFIPSNCTLLQAPKLNIEISAAVVEMIRLRDKKVEPNQQQLGIGIAAISKAMTSLLTTESKIDAIKTLSDGCRILCDLHHLESQARIKMITPALAKPFLNVMQNSERDDTLFGASFPDKIKASKTIEKQGLQIKKQTAQPARPNPAAAQSTIMARQSYQGNWSGPPQWRSEGIPLVDASSDIYLCDSVGAAQGELQSITCSSTLVTQVHSGRIQFFIIVGYILRIILLFLAGSYMES